MAITGNQLAQTVARAGLARAGCCRAGFVPRAGLTQGATPGSEGGRYVYRDILYGAQAATNPEQDSEYTVVED